MSKRIIALFISFVMLFSCVPPAHADYVSDNTGANFWDWRLIRLNKELSTTDLGGLVQVVTGFLTGKVCQISPDSYHHGSKTAGMGTGGTDEHGRYAQVICDYCGATFKAYSSFKDGGGGGFGGDFQRSYEDQVTTLPATGIDSAGALLWSPRFSYVDLNNVSCSHHLSGGSLLDDNSSISYTCNCDGSGSFYAESTSPTSGYKWKSINYHFSGVAPVTGSYTLLAGLGMRGVFAEVGGAPRNIGQDFTAGSLASYSKGNVISFTLRHSQPLYYHFAYLSASCSLPVYKVEPVTPVSGDTYNINSRPATIIGDYGIIGDNGQITKVEGDTIINETNKTVYNPITNTTNNFTDWQYDYSTRTYNITLDNGTTQTITYGDEHVTITEIDNSAGDTITNNYTIYYVVDDPGPGDDPGPSTPAPCAHSWTETSSTAATCTVSGSRHLTCSLCNVTKTETIPAPGHTWQIKQTVNTEYDDTGQLVQEGYIVYQCSVCGEQYKATDGNPPPGGGGSGSGDWWKDAMDRLGDLLGSNGLLGIFSPVAEAFGTLWSWLPPEIVAVFTVGVTLLVAAAVFKFFL